MRLRVMWWPSNRWYRCGRVPQWVIRDEWQWLLVLGKVAIGYKAVPIVKPGLLYMTADGGIGINRDVLTEADEIFDKLAGLSPHVAEHDITDVECWCHPDLLQVCPECDGTDETKSCWRCSGEKTVAVYDSERPMIVVHHDISGASVDQPDAP